MIYNKVSQAKFFSSSKSFFYNMIHSKIKGFENDISIHGNIHISSLIDNNVLLDSIDKVANFSNEKISRNLTYNLTNQITYIVCANNTVLNNLINTFINVKYFDDVSLGHLKFIHYQYCAYMGINYDSSHYNIEKYSDNNFTNIFLSFTDSNNQTYYVDFLRLYVSSGSSDLIYNNLYDGLYLYSNFILSYDISQNIDFVSNIILFFNLVYEGLINFTYSDTNSDQIYDDTFDILEKALDKIKNNINKNYFIMVRKNNQKYNIEITNNSSTFKNYWKNVNLKNIVSKIKDRKNEIKDISIKDQTKTGVMLRDNFTQFNNYNSELKKLDSAKKSVIRNYTEIFYKSLNSYLIKSIYNMTDYNPSLSNNNYHIYNVCRHLSRKYNNDIFESKDDYVYLIRSENFINTHSIGGYDNIKIGQKFINPCSYSTTLSYNFGPNVKDVFLKIKLYPSANFVILTEYSTLPQEKEVLLPFGCIFEVTKIENKSLSRTNYTKYVKYIELECRKTIDFDNINQFINLYKYDYLNQIDYVTPFNQSIDINTVFDKIVNNDYKITDFIRLNDIISYSPINVLPIQNVDPKDPYKIIDKKFKIQDLPPFDSMRAFKNEFIDFSPSFCSLKKKSFSSGDFNIFTFNVHNFVKVCKKSGRNFNNFIDFIDNFQSNNNVNIDVISLQEVTPIYFSKPSNQKELRNGSFTPLVDAMNKLGFNHYYLTNSNYDLDSFSNQNIDYFILANAIFTKHPIVKSYSYGLLDNRSVQLVKLSFKNIYINVINTHIEWDKNKVSRFSDTMNVLDVQISQLLDIFYFSDCITFVTGDFNGNIINDNKYQYLWNSIYDIVPSNDFPYFTGLNSRDVIDFVFTLSNPYTQKLKPVMSKSNNIVFSDVSDHYPVFCPFSINTGESTHKDNKNLYLQYKKIKTNSSFENTIIDYFKNYHSNNTNIISISFGIRKKGFDIYVLEDFHNLNKYPFYLKLSFNNYKKFSNKIINILDSLSNTFTFSFSFNNRYKKHPIRNILLKKFKYI